MKTEIYHLFHLIFALLTLWTWTVYFSAKYCINSKVKQTLMLICFSSLLAFLEKSTFKKAFSH